MPFEYCGVPIATLIYLMLDLYPSVKSFPAIFRTGSFWLLWLLFTVFDVIALAALEVSARPTVANLVKNDSITVLTLICLSTAGALTIIQSFTLKLSDFKFVDLGSYVETFRKTVLADIANQVLKTANRKQRTLAGRIRQKFQGDLPGLRNAYVRLASFGGRDLQQIEQELQTLEQASKDQVVFSDQLALRIAKIDPDGAEELCL
jgi:hypothetical protein